MPRRTVLDQFIHELAAAVAAKLGNLNGTITGTRGLADGRRKSPMKGKHFSEAKMRCRWPGDCKNRSLGPKNHWLCAKHLPKWGPKVKAAIQENAAAGSK